MGPVKPDDMVSRLFGWSIWVLRNFRPPKNWSLGCAIFIEVINVHSVILLGIGSPQETPLEVLALSAEKTGFV